MNFAASTINVACPHCRTANRVPEARLEESPSCGACKQPLFDGHPLELSDSDFARYVANTDLPVVVDFWAPWCGPCRAMAPVFERAARELEPRVRFVKVNTDEQPGLADRFAIRGIPTIAILKNGKEAARTAGAMDAPRFVAWIRANT